MNNAMGLTTPLPEAASTQCFTMDDDGDVLAAGPLALDEQWPQIQVLRRTVEQIGSGTCSRRFCAADGGPAGGSACPLRYADCRPGYRSSRASPVVLVLFSVRRSW